MGRSREFLLRRDIDIIAEKVKAQVPHVLMEQLKAVHPSEEDWLWWFKLPGIGKNIQLESANGQFPFTVEHDDMPSRKHAVRVQTHAEAVNLVVQYLRQIKSGDPVF